MLDNLLRGDVFGNGCPVHPALVNMPLALYPLSALLRLVGTLPEVASLFDGLDTGSFYAGAHYLNLAALLVTIPTAITGFVEYKTINKQNSEALSVVHKHIGLNLLVSSIGLFNFLALNSVPGFVPETIHVVLGIVGGLLLWYSGHLGGQLVYEHGIGVQRQGRCRRKRRE